MTQGCKQFRVMTTAEWIAVHGPHGHPEMRPAEYQPPRGTYQINMLVCPCGAKYFTTPERMKTMAENNDELTIVPTSRDVIERKLLSALSDGSQVAILATESDLELLIEALHVFGTTPALEWARDLKRLRSESFGGFPS